MKKSVKIYRLEETVDVVMPEDSEQEFQTHVVTFEASEQWLKLGVTGQTFANLKAGKTVEGWRLLGWYEEEIDVPPWEEQRDVIEYDDKGKATIVTVTDKGELDDNHSPLIYRTGDAMTKVELTTLDVGQPAAKPKKELPAVVWHRRANDDEWKATGKGNIDSALAFASGVLELEGSMQIKVYEIPTAESEPVKDNLVESYNC